MRDLLRPLISLAGAGILGAAAGALYPNQLEAWRALLWTAVGLLLFAAVALAVHSLRTKKPKRPKTPERDVGIGEAIAFMCLGKWGSKFMEAVGAMGVDATANYNSLLQAAADGTIPVWGKRQNYGVYEPIAKEFWFENDFEWFSLLRGDGHSQSKKSTFQGDRYLSLMTSRAAVESLKR